MNTQTQTTSKGQLALVLVGILLIPLYAVYFNETPKEKIDRLKNDEIVHMEENSINSKLESNKLFTSKLNYEDPDKMDFHEAFNYYRKIHGEGYVFSWKGYEYLVEIFKPIIPASKYDTLSFNDAFKLARNELGVSNQFEWRGAIYSTNIVGEVENSKKIVNNILIDKNNQIQSKQKTVEKTNNRQKDYLYGMNNADHYHNEPSVLSACYTPAELCKHNVY